MADARWSATRFCEAGARQYVQGVSSNVLPDMSFARLFARFRGPIAIWALAGVSLLVSHDAIFMAQIGPGEGLANALRQAGHDYWGVASLVLACTGIAVLGATIVRLRALRRTADALGAIPPSGSRRFGARWLRALARLLPVVAIGFLMQENIEHLTAHGHAPGLGALLGPEYPLALPVLALITGLAAFIAATLSQTELALLAVIHDALQRFIGRAPRRTLRPPVRLAAVLGSPLARACAGRAPPRLLVSVT